MFEPEFPGAGNTDVHIVCGIDNGRSCLIAQVFRGALGPYKDMGIEENSHQCRRFRVLRSRAALNGLATALSKSDSICLSAAFQSRHHAVQSIPVACSAN